LTAPSNKKTIKGLSKSAPADVKPSKSNKKSQRESKSVPSKSKPKDSKPVKDSKPRSKSQPGRTPKDGAQKEANKGDVDQVKTAWSRRPQQEVGRPRISTARSTMSAAASQRGSPDNGRSSIMSMFESGRRTNMTSHDGRRTNMSSWDGRMTKMSLAGRQTRFGVTVIPESSSSSGEAPPSPTLSTREQKKRRVKKVVDYVYTMECAYGSSIAPLLEKLTLIDEETPRRNLRPKVEEARGLTNILSGRVTAMAKKRVVHSRI